MGLLFFSRRLFVLACVKASLEERVSLAASLKKVKGPFCHGWWGTRRVPLLSPLLVDPSTAVTTVFSSCIFPLLLLLLAVCFFRKALLRSWLEMSRAFHWSKVSECTPRDGATRGASVSKARALRSPSASPRLPSWASRLVPSRVPVYRADACRRKR